MKMNEKQMKLILLFCLIPVILCAQPPQKRVWNFNDLKGWEYGHQDTNPDNQCVLENGKLRIFTRAGSVDRKKVRTAEKVYTSGRYMWRTYIPQMGVGDQSSVGSWIYCDDEHELDFEVGYGKDEVRKQLNAAPNEMIAYMTSQAHPFLSVPVAIKTGWHIFEMDLQIKNGKYFIRWIIDGKVKSSTELGYGEETAFYIFCSVENLKFIGDNPATQDNYGLFDYVKYRYHD